MKTRSFLLILAFTMQVLTLCDGFAEAPLVQVVARPGGFSLLRGGRPYFVRGAGGDTRQLPALAAAGGNSFRLWGDVNLGATLDAAQAAGLTVCAGFWVGQLRQGFDWSNPAAVAQQRERLRQVVLKYRDHPALLVWAVGNEMEDPQGKNAAMWRGVNDLAAMVKELDPRHPTMTVIAEIGGEKVANLQQLCPAIDIIGINSYGSAATLGARYVKAGGTKPYLLTEFGPPGIWEMRKDGLGAYEEPTSTEKAVLYQRAYEGAVAAQPGRCLGSYVFYWGQKQEVTSTWFSMFLRDGTRLAAVDTMQGLWTGQLPRYRCPAISAPALDSPTRTPPGATLHATANVTPGSDSTLRAEWTLEEDTGSFGTGGDAETPPVAIAGAILSSDLKGATVHMPSSGGLYRLRVTVRDALGSGATSSLCLRVNGPKSPPPHAAPASLPLLIYPAGTEPPPYVPSGWMGNTKAIELDPLSMEQPRAGDHCLRCAFTATRGWGGVTWQSPANDWGDRPGGYDLSAASKLGFWARGARGGEVVTFGYGGIPATRPYPDSSTARLEKVKLTGEWRHYEIAVQGSNLARIKSGFFWSAASTGQPIIFYLDEVRWN